MGSFLTMFTDDDIVKQLCDFRTHEGREPNLILVSHKTYNKLIHLYYNNYKIKTSPIIKDIGNLRIKDTAILYGIVLLPDNKIKDGELLILNTYTYIDTLLH